MVFMFSGTCNTSQPVVTIRTTRFHIRSTHTPDYTVLQRTRLLTSIAIELFCYVMQCRQIGLGENFCHPLRGRSRVKHGGIISYHIISYHIISYHIISYHNIYIKSHYISSYHTSYISYISYILSYHTISYIISNRIIIYHRIVSCHNKYNII